MKKEFEELGDRIKLFLANQSLEEKKNIEGLIQKLDEQLEIAKGKDNSDMVKGIEELKKELKNKKLEVKVAAPNVKVTVPKPLVKVLQETKEAEKIVKLLEQYLKLNLKFYQTKEGGTFITNRSAADAVPVVLTDAGLKKFYNAVSTAVSQSQDPFVNPAGHRRPANVDANGNLIVEVTVEPLDLELSKDTSSIAIWSNTVKDGSGTDLQPLLDADGHFQIDVLTMPAIEVDFPDTIDIGNFPTSFEVSNFPAEYPLPAGQVATLTPPAALTDYATETKQDTIITALGPLATQATLASVLAKIIAAPATEAKQDTGNASLASILAKIIAAPSTEAKQDTIITALGGLATQTTLAAILAKIIAAPSTEAKQDAIISLLTLLEAKDFATENTLDQAFQELQDLNLVDFSTEATLQDILAAIEPSNVSNTGTSSSVGDSATNVTLLSANANRKGGTFYNDSTATLYLKMGATASSSSFTVVLPPRAYYELPFKYTGIIDGIWTSAAGGFCRITELT